MAGPGALNSLVDGVAAADLPLAERALHYGDGLFETFAVRRGQPTLWDAHWARLAAGCQRLGLPVPDQARLRAEAETLCKHQDRAVLKLIYSAGDGGRGYARAEPARPRRILRLYPAPEHPIGYWRQGVSARLCTLRLSEQPALAGIKHLNRLEQVLARREWSDPAIAEGLCLDSHGQLAEAISSNVFVLSGGRLLTPSLERRGVRGVMRAQVLALAARLGVPAAETALSLEALLTAEEVFLSNSLIGIWPLARLGEREYGVGPVTRRLRDEVAAARISLAPDEIEHG